MNEVLLNKLRCFKCNSLLVPPIHLCLGGHSRCKACREKIKRCDNCNLIFTSGRNHLVENLTQIVQYPCHYDNCSYLGLLKSIPIHESACEFQPYPCPIASDCDWSGGQRKMFGHIKAKHETQLVSSINGIFLNQTLQTGRYLLNFSGNLFLLQIVLEEDVQVQVKSFQRYEKSKFMYTIRFVDDKNVEDLALTRICANYYKDAFVSLHASSIGIARSDTNAYRTELTIKRVKE